MFTIQGVGLSAGVTGVLLLAYWRRQRAPPAPDVMDLHPEQWLDIDEEQEKREYVMQVKMEEEARRSHRRSGGEREDEGRERERGQVALELGSQEKSEDGGFREWNEEEEREEREMIIVEDVMFAPDPFTPSPLLMYSIWGVPLTSSLKVLSHSHVTLPETEMRELSGRKEGEREGEGEVDMSEVRSHVNLVEAEQQAQASQSSSSITSPSSSSGSYANLPSSVTSPSQTLFSPSSSPPSSPPPSSAPSPSRGSGSAAERRNSSTAGPASSFGESLKSLAKGSSSYSALPQNEDQDGATHEISL